VNFVASWRTALRIARREARRAKGRSSLVGAMIALPVLALTFAAVSYDMLTLTGAEKADRTMGTGDARIVWQTHMPLMQMPDPGDGYQYGGDGSGPQGVAQAGAATQEEQNKPGTTAELQAQLPGSTVLPLRRGAVRVKTPDGQGSPDAVMVDAASPLADGYVSLLEGRAPASDSEVALTAQAMEYLDTTIGGTVSVVGDTTTRKYTVVGRVEFPSLLDSVLLFAYDSNDESVQRWFQIRDDSWLVDTPDPIDWQRVQQLNGKGMLVYSRAVFEHPPADDAVPLKQLWQQQRQVDTRTLAAGVLVAGLALLEVVLLAGPAFAVGARRRQRQLALVAANGGTPAHVRRIVLADGVVLGLVGAVAGIVIGIAGAFAARPLVERLVTHARDGGYRVFPTALVAITALAILTGVAAALVPAFIAARQSVVASLRGRRGVTRSRKRWIAVGLVMIGGGAAITFVGTRNVDSTVMLAGLVIGELGLVLCTPAMVGLVARVGRLLPLAPRIALRDAARNRAAAAPAISAVMAAVAGTVALGMLLDSNQAHNRATYYQETPTGTVTLQWGADPNHPTDVGALEQALRSTLPVADVHRVSYATCAPGGPEGSNCYVGLALSDACPQLVKLMNGAGGLSDAEREAAGKNPACDIRNQYSGAGGVVDDGGALATLTGASGDDLAAAQAMLRAGGVVVRAPIYIKDGKVTLEVHRSQPDPQTGDKTVPAEGAVSGSPLNVSIPGEDLTTLTVPGYLLTSDIGPGPAIFSPQAVAQAGLASREGMIVAATTRMPDQAAEEHANAVLTSLGAYAFVEHGFSNEIDPRLLVLICAAGLITIGAAAVGTGLAAADGRADLSTLASVGASPSVRRGLSISQSGVIAGLGSLIGAVAGMATAVAVLAALGQAYDRLWPATGPVQPVMPWLTLGVVLVAIPLISVLGAGLFTRSRLPIERRL